MSEGHHRLGGSAFAQTEGQIGEICPDITDAVLLKGVFEVVQMLIKEGKILAGHDRSDGGLITTLIEMCISSGIGCSLQLLVRHQTLFHYLFSEEVGIVLEILPEHIHVVEQRFRNIAPIYQIGKTTEEPTIRISVEDSEIYYKSLSELIGVWEETSCHLEMLQAEKSCVEAEYEMLQHPTTPKVYIPKKCVKQCDVRISAEPFFLHETQPKVAILREEGSNGEREMASAFYSAGFKVIDITMNDMVESKTDLIASCRGIVFVGGFSYSDVFGAGVGWYQVIKANEKINNQFERFYHREDTFSLGVCNGCQLMALLKWIPGRCKLKKNKSGRFESRFPTVNISRSPSIMLSGMEGCQIGVWVAHGEGRFEMDKIPNQYTPIQYIGRSGEPTEKYPFNPNGSVDGVAAVCSEDGRHLAMMPHPERCFMNWQNPWVPADYPLPNDSYSPWMMMFLNAYRWCME